MAESSRPWPGDSGAGGAGDCGPYSADQWDDLWERMFTQDNSATEGVMPGVDGELAATNPGANTVRIASGAAIVKGKGYINTANVDVTIPTPAAATRIDRVVLRAIWGTTQTIRVTRIAGTEGGAAPAITQTDANTWDLKLCQVSITTGGAITITDERVYCHYATKVSTAMLDTGVLSADAAGRAAMAAGYFSADATGQGKFANGFLTADAGGRALMADGFVNADKLASGISAVAKGFDADKIDGYHASDLIAGGVILGAIILWSGTLGGSDGHRPMIGGSTPNEDWHICNGEMVGSVQTPDLRDKFIMCAGTTYAKGATGGNTTINFSHWHSPGTLQVQSHQHGGDFLTVSSVITVNGCTSYGETDTNLDGMHASRSIGNHSHAATAVNTVGGFTDSENPFVNAGVTANALTTTNILPPYIAMYYIMKVA